MEDRRKPTYHEWLAANAFTDVDDIGRMYSKSAEPSDKPSISGVQRVNPARVSEQKPYLRTMPYDQYLRTEHWQSVRRAALARADYRCQICNSPKNLEVHHRTYERRGAERDNDVTVLCDKCHGRFHKESHLAKTSDRTHRASYTKRSYRKRRPVASRGTESFPMGIWALCIVGFVLFLLGVSIFDWATGRTANTSPSGAGFLVDGDATAAAGVAASATVGENYANGLETQTAPTATPRQTSDARLATVPVPPKPTLIVVPTLPTSNPLTVLGAITGTAIITSTGPVAGTDNECPIGYPIKADDNGGVYRVPGGLLYDSTNARNCFSNEDAARSAGYQPSKV